MIKQFLYLLTAMALISCAKETKVQEMDPTLKGPAPVTSDFTTVNQLLELTGTIEDPPSGYDYAHPELLNDAIVKLYTDPSGNLSEVYILNENDYPELVPAHCDQDAEVSTGGNGVKTVVCDGPGNQCHVNDDCSIDFCYDDVGNYN